MQDFRKQGNVSHCPSNEIHTLKVCLRFVCLECRQLVANSLTAYRLLYKFIGEARIFYHYFLQQVDIPDLFRCKRSIKFDAMVSSMRIPRAIFSKLEVVYIYLFMLLAINPLDQYLFGECSIYFYHLL